MSRRTNALVQLDSSAGVAAVHLQYDSSLPVWAARWLGCPAVSVPTIPTPVKRIQVLNELCSCLMYNLNDWTLDLPMVPIRRLWIRCRRYLWSVWFYCRWSNERHVLCRRSKRIPVNHGRVRVATIAYRIRYANQRHHRRHRQRNCVDRQGHSVEFCRDDADAVILIFVVCTANDYVYVAAPVAVIVGEANDYDHDDVLSIASSACHEIDFSVDLSPLIWLFERNKKIIIYHRLTVEMLSKLTLIVVSPSNDCVSLFSYCGLCLDLFHDPSLDLYHEIVSFHDVHLYRDGCL